MPPFEAELQLRADPNMPIQMHVPHAKKTENMLANSSDRDSASFNLQSEEKKIEST